MQLSNIVALAMAVVWSHAGCDFATGLQLSSSAASLAMNDLLISDDLDAASITSSGPTPILGGETLPAYSTSGPHGTSTLQLEEGIFRMIQGSAYRAFRPNYAYDSNGVDTHPYLFVDFVEHVERFGELYPVLPGEGSNTTTLSIWSELSGILREEYESALADAANDTKVEKRLIKRYPQGGPDDRFLTAAQEKMYRQRQNKSGENSDPQDSEVPFMSTFQEVMLRLDSNGNVVTGLIPTKFWYDRFMPTLLRACNAEISASPPSEKELDSWFSKERPSLENFGTDLLQAWPTASYDLKLNLRMSWRMAVTYLNGPGKLRECGEECSTDGRRYNGELSQYVAFIDVPLNRSYVETKAMRTSWGYFVGSATWISWHTIIERINLADNPTVESLLIEKFANFFKTVGGVLACPFCRGHFLDYVSVNNPIEQPLYPIEYIFVGWNPRDASASLDGTVTLDDRLATISNARILRLFLWKLHNAVSSSIERDELWYRLDQHPLYTTRYWPNVNSAVWYTNASSMNSVQTEWLGDALNVLRFGISLDRLRPSVLDLANSTEDVRASVAGLAFGGIDQIDSAMERSRNLQTVYFFNSLITDDEYIESAASFAEQIGSLARSNDFVHDSIPSS